MTSFGLPTIFYYQLVRGMTPTQSALMSIPLAVFSGGLAPFAGRLVDRGHAKIMNIGGMFVFVVGLVLYAVLMTPEQPIWVQLIPSAVVGIANAGIWGPLATLATRGLPPQLAGAGSGIYNTTRQVGAVLGSAAIAALMQARLSAELPTGGHDAPAGELAAGHLPGFLQAGFSAAMGQSVLLPAALGAVGLAVALFFVKVPAALEKPAGHPDKVAEHR